MTTKYYLFFKTGLQIFLKFLSLLLIPRQIYYAAEAVAPTLC